MFRFETPLRHPDPLVLLAEHAVGDAVPWLLGVKDGDVKAVEDLDGS